MPRGILQTKNMDEENDDDSKVSALGSIRRRFRFLEFAIIYAEVEAEDFYQRKRTMKIVAILRDPRWSEQGKSDDAKSAYGTYR
ncbi:hypothetical protein U1Q18_050918 [Sarracenia purpurea var. burkii]